MQCIYPKCDNTSRTRGLCHGHYQNMRAYVRKGQASEEDLERRGLLMPKGTGGSKTNGSQLFKLGCTEWGDGPLKLARKEAS